MAIVSSYEHDRRARRHTYVALAEALGTSLLTGDEAIRGAAGVRCPVELIG